MLSMVSVAGRYDGQTVGMRLVLVIVGVVVLIVIVALVIYLIVAYNGLIRRRNQIENAWSQIDVQLKRRLDLIPNLVETVKGYAAHEKETLDAVISARNAAVAAPDTPAAQAKAEGALTGTLRQLFALGEAYPDLKANQNFLALQEELSSTEGRVRTPVSTTTTACWPTTTSCSSSRR